MKKLKRVQPKRKFSEEFKRSIVKEYEAGSFSALQLSKLYGIHFQTVYNWVYKYSKLSKKNIIVVEKKNSSSEKLKAYEKRIKELEQIVGQKQIKLDYLEKLVDIASKDLEVDIKKNFDIQHSNGLGSISKQ